MASLSLLSHAKEIWTLAGLARKQGRKPQLEDAEVIKNGVIVFDREGTIQFVGPKKNLPKKWFKNIKREISAQNGYVLPGFIESHTHLTFCGSRSAELDLRNQGLSYQDIARQGGGILSTVRCVRKATLKELTSKNEEHISHFYRQGVVVVEAKSGYGLNPKEELKMLRSLEQAETPVTVIPTFLGAHSLPPEYPDWESYLSELIQHFPLFRKRASRIDVFIDQGFCPLSLARHYLTEAKKWQFAITIHADQLTHQGAARLGVELGAQSVDHVIHVTDQDMAALARSSTVAVLLPIADLYLKCPYPPARQLIDQGAIVALSTDFNPGTAPTQSLGLVSLLARLEMKLSTIEVLSALTVGAAQALGLLKQVGSLEVGKWASFQIYEQSPLDLFYSADPLRPRQVIHQGRRVV